MIGDCYLISLFVFNSHHNCIGALITFTFYDGETEVQGKNLPQITWLIGDNAVGTEPGFLTYCALLTPD